MDQWSGGLGSNYFISPLGESQIFDVIMENVLIFSSKFLSLAFKPCLHTGALSRLKMSY